MEELLTVWHHQYGKGKENADIVSVYCELEGILVMSGKFNEVSDLPNKWIQMSCDIHGLGCVHPSVANPMSELGRLYQEQGKLEGALKMHEICFGMRQAIYGKEWAHSGIAASVNNLK